ncbi:hypothetical protein DKM19_22150 [Streptosporangium sp. 'caverna']|nr:hypothetical protein DKM19_22150 [Streptosporangium sp. 'caverna']
MVDGLITTTRPVTTRSFRCCFYRAAVDVSRSTLNYVAGLIRRRRKAIGSIWRRLNPGKQALLVLVYLRKGETFSELAARLGVSTATAPSTAAPRYARRCFWAAYVSGAALTADGTQTLRRAPRDALETTGAARPAGARMGHPMLAALADSFASSSSSAPTRVCSPPALVQEAVGWIRGAGAGSPRRSS